MASIYTPEAEYTVPYWIANEGRYMQNGVFNPDAFDPQAPNAERRGKKYKLTSSGEDLHPDPFDLENLLFVQPKTVIEFLERLEEATKTAKKTGQKIVGIISTGGTLTMSMNEKGILVPRLNPNQLIAAAGEGISKKFIAVGMELMRIDSSQYEYAYGGDLTIIMSYIWSQASGDLREALVGFEVPHGTDTNVESATNVMAQLGPNIPFNAGFVSAQQTLESEPNDVGSNVYLTTVLLGLMQKRKMANVFLLGGGSSGGALNPAWSKKVTDSRVRTFESAYGDPIATTDDFVVNGMSNVFGDRYRKSMGAETNDKFLPFIIDGYKSVVQLDASVGRDPRLIHDTIEAAITSNRGIVGINLTTFGGFTENNKTLSVVERLKRKYDLLILASSPFAQGQTHNYGPAKRIQDELDGVITRMSPHAVSTIITLTNRVWPGNRKKIREFMEEWDYVGAQAPLPEDRDTGINVSSIRHLGAPPELSQRTPV